MCFVAGNFGDRYFGTDAPSDWYESDEGMDYWLFRVLGREGLLFVSPYPYSTFVPDAWPPTTWHHPHPPQNTTQTRNLPSPLRQFLCAMPNSAAMPLAIPEALCLSSQGPSLEHPLTAFVSLKHSAWTHTTEDGRKRLAVLRTVHFSLFFPPLMFVCGEAWWVIAFHKALSCRGIFCSPTGKGIAGSKGS